MYSCRVLADMHTSSTTSKVAAGEMDGAGQAACGARVVFRKIWIYPSDSCLKARGLGAVYVWTTNTATAPSSTTVDPGRHSRPRRSHRQGGGCLRRPWPDHLLYRNFSIKVGQSNRERRHLARACLECLLVLVLALGYQRKNAPTGVDSSREHPNIPIPSHPIHPRSPIRPKLPIPSRPSGRIRKPCPRKDLTPAAHSPRPKTTNAA
ncbi:hypothetical protein EDC01DRAFT_441898 [Geopyxis carbonaria]|nr:hypothetical protein EDC01DRAFT_441898 [Geopyxis carbonaria]